MTGTAQRLAVIPGDDRPVIHGGEVRVVEHEATGSHYMRLVLEAPAIAASALPGQFVMLTAARAGETVPALPRPMAIYAIDTVRGLVTIVYALVGRGTRRLAEFTPGESMHVVGPLGRGFDIPLRTDAVLLLGRGIGTCSLTTVAEYDARAGIETYAVTSARTRRALVGGDLYRAMGASVVLEVTDDEGTSAPDAVFARLVGMVDDRPPQLVLVCGSNRLTAVALQLGERWGASVQVSLEAHMACGIGYCHGCSTGERTSALEEPLVCKAGPVFAVAGRGC